jgi:hypothetical protein
VNLLNPGKGSNTHGEEQVIDVDAGDEPDALGPSAGAIFERFCHDSRTDKHRASDDVPTDQGNPSADFVKEKDTHDLTDNSNRIVDTVYQEGAVLEAHRCIDICRVVLDGRNTGHLNRELQNDTVEDLSKIGFVLEDLRCQ